MKCKKKKLSGSRTSLRTHQKQRPPKIAIVNFSLKMNLFVNPGCRDVPKGTTIYLEKREEGGNPISPSEKIGRSQFLFYPSRPLLKTWSILSFCSLK